MKIAMLNCLNANEVCTGAGCLKAFNARSRHFAEYGETPLELVAMARCNGCGKGIDEGFREKLSGSPRSARVSKKFSLNRTSSQQSSDPTGLTQY